MTETQNALTDYRNSSLYSQDKAFFINLSWNQMLLHLYPKCMLEVGSKNYQSFINFASNPQKYVFEKYT